MLICEFCLERAENGQCRLGLRIPQKMSCRDFQPGLEKFCAKPEDFVDSAQILQMAKYFGLKGTELKKINLMVRRETELRSASPGLE